ncbi:hypothetical protein B4U80_13299 [Leptotrombidium deliense]|uniref:RRM domain-containing protein n=1 Tax=Leptotrombidium deliense TaxID=299467 RepID=A0A443S8S9_9ACAR|nr:hypothetical protein B4U80_13299 [Leptotrombidium deliense]
MDLVQKPVKDLYVGRCIADLQRIADGDGEVFGCTDWTEYYIFANIAVLEGEQELAYILYSKIMNKYFNDEIEQQISFDGKINDCYEIKSKLEETLRRRYADDLSPILKTPNILVDENCVFLQNLSPFIKKTKIKKLFAKYGTIEYMWISDGEDLRHGYIEYYDKSSVSVAIQKEDGKVYDGFELFVQPFNYSPAELVKAEFTSSEAIAGECSSVVKADEAVKSAESGSNILITNEAENVVPGKRDDSDFVLVNGDEASEIKPFSKKLIDNDKVGNETSVLNNESLNSERIGNENKVTVSPKVTKSDNIRLRVMFNKGLLSKLLTDASSERKLELFFKRFGEVSCVKISLGKDDDTTGVALIEFKNSNNTGIAYSEVKRLIRKKQVVVDYSPVGVEYRSQCASLQHLWKSAIFKGGGLNQNVSANNLQMSDRNLTESLLKMKLSNDNFVEINVYTDNFGDHISSVDELKKLFEKFGPLRYAKFCSCIRNENKVESYGRVCFFNECHAREAYTQMNGFCVRSGGILRLRPKVKKE